MPLFDFLTNWRTSSKIKSLEAQLRGRPTPQIYLQLADAYKQAGNSHKAAQILKLGASRFPSAPEISRRQAEAEKIERENEKRRLKERIQTHPNQILYARLAELYKADGDIDRTVEIAEAGIKAFPRYGGTYMVLGQVFIDRQDWDKACSYLEKSVELDKYNYMALKLLAQVYMQLGRPADAARRLEDILYFAPGDEAILELLKKAKEAAGESIEPAAKASSAESSVFPDPRKASASGQRKTITLGRLADQQAGSPTAARDRALNEGVVVIRQVEGVDGVILVDQYGLVVAADLDESIDEGLAGALITNVYRTASGNAAQLGVGVFEEGLIEGETGNVHLAQVGEMILAVFANRKVKMGLLEKSIRDFAMSVIES